jgi:hypothetical protein
MTAPALQKHLLVVEDNDQDATFLRRAIEQTGVSLPHTIVKDGTRRSPISAEPTSSPIAGGIPFLP